VQQNSPFYRRLIETFPLFVTFFNLIKINGKYIERFRKVFFCRRDFANEQQNLLFNFEEITESSLAKLKLISGAIKLHKNRSQLEILFKRSS